MTILTQNPQDCTHATSIPLYAPGRAGSPVAFVRGRTLCKGIHATHYLTRPAGAIAFDANVLADAERLGAVRVEVRDRDSGTVYTCSLASFRAHGFSVTRGYGRQWGLERGWWSIDCAPGVLDERERTQAAKRSQLSLWGAE